MSFVERELQRTQKAMADPANKDRYAELYAVQQALSFALEPLGVASPVKMITGNTEGLGDYHRTTPPGPPVPENFAENAA